MGGRGRGGVEEVGVLLPFEEESFPHHLVSLE